MLGLVTGNTSMTAPIKLQAAGFDPEVFVVGSFGSESDDRNELPRIALDRAIALSGQTIMPQDVIIVGDTVKDVDCARALGAVVATVFTGFESRENLINARPDYLLDDLTQFLTNVPL
jgi:phosphoglycolate phosphatase-like HAD superfamily hydrolase